MLLKGKILIIIWNYRINNTLIIIKGESNENIFLSYMIASNDTPNMAKEQHIISRNWEVTYTHAMANGPDNSHERISKLL